MASAQVNQSVVQLVANASPNVRVMQSVVQLVIIPGPPPPGAPPPIPPLAGAGGFRPSTCGCSPDVLDAERLRRLLARLRSWPYPLLYPPDGAIPVETVHSIPAPALGATAVVYGLTVPDGFRLVVQGILQDYSGGAFLPGDALWTVDLNTPVGVPDTQAMPVQGLAGVPIPLGSVANGMLWPFAAPYHFRPSDLLQSKVQNVNLAGGFFTSGFFGYLLPEV